MIKDQLLRMMQEGDSRTAVQAVFDSGLLPFELRERWQTLVIERMIRSTIQCKCGCPDWYRWAYKWLNNLDRSSRSSQAACDLAWGGRLRVGAPDAAEAALAASKGDAMGVFMWAFHSYEDAIACHKILLDLIGEKESAKND